MPLILDGTEGITQPTITTAFGVPAGTTAQRPASPEAGMVRFNTDTGLLETYTGTEWSAGVDVEQAIADFAAGEPGQPRLVGNAVAVFPTGYPILTVTATPTYTLTNGRTIETLTTSTTNTNNPPTVAAARVTVSQYTGSMRFTIAVQSGCINNATMTYRVALFKNNVLVQQVDTTGTDCSTFYINVDSTCTPSDIMEWRMSTSRSDRAINLFETFVSASNVYTAATLFRPAV